VRRCAPDCGDEVHGTLGGEAIFCNKDDDVAPDAVKLARVGPYLTIVERPGDRIGARRIAMQPTGQTRSSGARRSSWTPTPR